MQFRPSPPEVADAVLWTGDAATAPHSLDLAPVTSALRTVVPDLALGPIGDRFSIADCGQILRAARDCTVAVIPPDVPSMSLVEIASPDFGAPRVTEPSATLAATRRGASRCPRWASRRRRSASHRRAMGASSR